jgi:aryl-alcohol dehydrogenase-like predicted oxidoreductase
MLRSGHLMACHPLPRRFPLPTDRRREYPRRSVDDIGKNAALLAPLERIAAAKRCTPAQAALAWLLAQRGDIVPIPGTKRRNYLEQNCAAVDVKLTKEDVDSLSRAFPLNVTAGTRYPEKQLAGLGI